MCRSSSTAALPSDWAAGPQLYPLPDQPPRPALVVAPGIHVSTALAYRVLNRPLTSPLESNILREFQTIAWTLDRPSLDQLPLKNDFEEAVFGTYQELAALSRKLHRLGARPALMTGSGSALFGIFQTAAQSRAAASHFPPGTAFPVRFVSRSHYRRLWLRSLGAAAEASCFASQSAE